MKLPNGFESIEVKNAGEAEVLVIAMTNGYHLAIDALHLGHRECTVRLYPPGAWEASGAAVAGLSFDGRDVSPTAWAERTSRTSLTGPN